MNMPMVAGRFVLPEVVVTHFGIQEGETVADYGAGSGFFLKVLSDAVGSTGKVEALEIQKQLVEKMGQYIESAMLGNVAVTWCDLEELGGTKLADGSIDRGIIVNSLFQIEDKETAVTEVSRTIKRGGKLFVIDWTESFGGIGPQPRDVFVADAAQALCESAGFRLENTFDAGDHHYGLAFVRV